MLKNLVTTYSLQTPQHPRRITRINSLFFNISCYHSTCTNYNTITNSYRKQGGIGSNRNATSNCSGPPGIFITCGSTIGKYIIYEHHTMTNKTIFSNGNTITNKGVRLNPRPIANYHITLYFYKRAYKTVI